MVMKEIKFENSKVKPNLFIIGATKSGTTSLHNYLNSHPQIFMCEPKEPGFFLGPEISRYKSVEDYLSLFERGTKSKIRGESSTGYTHYPLRKGVACKIYNFNPRAFIVYIIRDPIERTISHYWWNVRWEGERRDPYEAIIKDKFYQNVSYYALQIKQYLKFFSKDQIKILTLESLKKDPLGTLKNLFEWLGVDNTFIPPNLDQKYNPTPKVIIRSRSKLLEKVRYSKLWEKIGPLLPNSLRLFFRQLNEDIIDREKYDFTRIIEILRPIQQEQTRELIELFGRDFSEWKTLYEK